jgi:hypothetical protein
LGQKEINLLFAGEGNWPNGDRGVCCQLKKKNGYKFLVVCFNRQTFPKALPLDSISIL